MKQFKYVGKTYPIHDVKLKVTGKQCYVGDMKLHGLLYAKLLLSPIAHGTIKSIDISKAELLPGVIKIFTPFNTSKKMFNNYSFFIDQAVKKDEMLFTDKVRYIGDRVAAVVAEESDIAEEAIGLIEVNYEEYPVLVDPSEALGDNMVNIHPEGNLLSETEINLGDADAYIRKADLIIDDCVYTPKVHHAAIETHTCVASYDCAGKLTIWSPCQSSFGVRTVIAELFNMPYNKVRVIKTTMGGSFGGKQQAILEPVAAYITMSIGRPVKLQLNRRQTIIATTTRTATKIKMQTGVSQDGKILASKINVLADAGAYATNSIDLPAAMGKKLFRTYRIPHLNYKSKSVYTNTAVSGGCRGWGSPQINSAMEIHLDHVARELNMDPAEFRFLNLIYPGDMEKFTGITLGDARVRDCLKIGMDEFRWQDRKNNDKKMGRFRKGVGLACGGHVNGFYGKVQDHCTVILKMNEDGSFILNTGAHDQGCGTLTSLGQIIAEVLDVDPEFVTVLEADTERSPYDIGTYSSRVTYVTGTCALRAAEKVKDLILEHAAIILQKTKEYLRVGGGFVWAVGKEESKLSYRDIAVETQVKHQAEIIATETYRNKSNPGAYAVHFSEVEVDTETGMVKIIEYLAVHDIGKALNPGMVEGQIQGGVQMGIGMALCEEITVDAKGRPYNDSFRRYNLLNAPDMPDVLISLIEHEGDDGPFGAKSVGEIAVVPAAAAIVNAVNDALGMNLSQLPLTPKRILAVLSKKR